MFDVDGTGLISLPRLRYMFQAIGDPTAEEIADEFVDFCVSNADKEKTGEIDYELLVKTFFEKDQGINAAL